MKQLLHCLTALLIAAISTGVIASIVQTQVSLAELVSLGVPISLAARALTTLEDLARFGPVMAGIAAAALLPAILPASLAARSLKPAWRVIVFSLTAAAVLWVAFWMMRSVIPMPAIAATRLNVGHALMALTGLVGGGLFAVLTRATQHLETAKRRWSYIAPAALLAAPLSLFLVTAPRASETVEHVDPATYRIETIASGLNWPWSVAFVPDGRTLVTEMGGRLLAFAADGSVSQIALDGLPPIFNQGGVAGLMEVALDPEFAANGLIYLTMGYGDAAVNGTRLVRARLADDRIEDIRILFSSTPKPRAGNNGGRLAFLRDGTLVLTLGDGSTRREEAQNIANHLGTLIRVDRDGRPPADNPFVGRPEAAPEIYSLGHRNAQGIAFDTVSGDLMISEHGARGGDEINRIVAGANYGWPIVTGGIDYPFARVSPFRSLEGYEPAALEWTPSIAPAGLAIYQGSLFGDWSGDLLVPALKEQSVRRVIRRDGRIVGQQILLAELDERIRDVKVAPDGSIYVVTDGTEGRLLRVVPASSVRSPR